MANSHSLDLERSSSQYASIVSGSQTGLNISGSITVMAWIYIESLPASSGDRHSIVYRRKTSATSGGYWFNLRNNGGTQQLEFVATDSSGSEFLVQTHTMSTGRWYHVAAVWDSADGDVDFYVDGTNIGTAAGTKSTLNPQSETFYLGCGNIGSDAFDGLIDEVAVFNTNLSAATIQGYFRGSLVGNETNLQGYWKLDNDYTDETANGNDLTASGSPVFSTTVPFTGAQDISGTTALATSIEAYYEMEEASGTRVDSAASYDLTDVNTVAQGTGKQGNCADVEITNSEYLYHATTDTVLNPSGANLFTVAAWFNLESITGTHVIAVNKKTSNSVGDCYKIYVTSDGSVVCQTWASSGSFLTIDSGVDVSTSEWHHVAFVKAATNDWRVYVDGILRATSTSTRSNASTGLNGISIGAEDAGSSGVINYSDGLIDEVGVWSTALSQTDILDLYGNGDGIPYLGATVISPSTQSITASIPAYSVSTGNTISPNAQAATFSIPAYSLSTGATISPNAQVATFTIPAYVVDAGDALITPAVQTLTFSIPSYSVDYGVTLSPNTQVATFSVPAYSVGVSENISPATQSLTFSIPAYSVLFGKTISPNAQAATFSIPSYTVVPETTVSPNVQTATFTIPAYVVGIGSMVSPDVQVLTLSIPTLARFGAVWAKTPRPTDSTWSRTSRNST